MKLGQLGTAVPQDIIINKNIIFSNFTELVKIHLY